MAGWPLSGGGSSTEVCAAAHPWNSTISVITVYGGTGDWKQRLSYSPAHEDDAYLVVLDREGVVRWLHHGGFDSSRADELKALLASLVRPVDR